MLVCMMFSPLFYYFLKISFNRMYTNLRLLCNDFRPYYELKIHYYQLLEEKRLKLNNYMRQVADVKTCYAETLRNLEQISEEIHQVKILVIIIV